MDIDPAQELKYSSADGGVRHEPPEMFFREYDEKLGGYVLTLYWGDGDRIAVPEKINGIAVVGIGEKCFEAGTVTEVVLPRTVRFFRWGGRKCPGYASMRSITIPEGVTIIADNAFQNCRNLESIIIPDSVSKIGSCSFEYCENLSSAVFGKNVRFIGASAFSDCGSLTNLALPDNVEKIGSLAFAWCVSLERALEWHSRGQRFDPAYLHHQSLENAMFSRLFTFKEGSSFGVKIAQF